jgi:hypothetical protein
MLEREDGAIEPDGVIPVIPIVRISSCGCPLERRPIQQSRDPAHQLPLRQRHFRVVQSAWRRIRARSGVALLAFLLLPLIATAVAAQWGGGNRWARYESEMQDPVDDPPDASRKGEFILGRLRYRSSMDARGRFRGGGYSRWGIDANKGDRLFINILRRLTRIDTEAIETIVDVDSDEMFEIPFLFAVSVGDWELSPSQAARLGEYLRRGGFLLVDDFHNDREWERFMEGIRQMNLEAAPEELDISALPFHVLFDLKALIRVSGANVVHGSGIERGGVEPHWRAIMDPRGTGRMMVAISFNQDMGDGWEFADEPEYPEKLSSEAMRVGTNYVIYSMTH